MAFERMNDDLNIISKLGDIPGADDGLSAQELKALFDKASLLLQSFINNKLIPEIEKQNVGLPIGGGTMEGAINMNGQKLTGLNAPTADDEPGTKGYVDAAKNDANKHAEELVKTAAPYNYTHNSDFDQWVAQPGLCKSHAGSVAIYAGDRWILDSGTLTGVARADGNGYTNIKLTGTIRQIVANAPDVGTAAIEMVSGTADISYANGAITITSNGGVINNVRLFKGNYTADNMPVHQPKGYGAELAECRRYLADISGNYPGEHYYNSPTGQISILLAVPLREGVVPTLSISTLSASNFIVTAKNDAFISGTIKVIGSYYNRLALEYTTNTAHERQSIVSRFYEVYVSADLPEE